MLIIHLEQRCSPLRIDLCGYAQSPSYLQALEVSRFVRGLSSKPQVLDLRFLHNRIDL